MHQHAVRLSFATRSSFSEVETQQTLLPVFEQLVQCDLSASTSTGKSIRTAIQEAVQKKKGCDPLPLFI